MQRSLVFILVALVGFLLVPHSASIAASVSLNAKVSGEPPADPLHVKFYVYEPEDREQYLSWGHATKAARVQPGTFDVVVRYRNGEIERERVFKEIDVQGDIELGVDFNVSIARLTVHLTRGGAPVPVYAGKYSVYRAGARGKPLASKRPGETLIITPGRYDIEASFRSDRGLRTTWVESYELSGVRQETIEMGGEATRLTLTLVRNGQPLPSGTARWRVFEAGKRTTPVAERGSGETLYLSPGRYDIGLFHVVDGKTAERWLNGFDVSGTMSRSVDLGSEWTTLEVMIHRGGRMLQGAWFEAYPPGRRDAEVVSGENGAEVQIEPGTYDIGCFYHSSGLRAASWYADQEISGGAEFVADLDLTPAKIRVRPERARNSKRKDGPSSVLVIVDSSAEMGMSLGGRPRIDVARKALKDAVRELLGSDVRLGLRAWGIAPRSQRSCKDSVLLVPPDRLDRPVLNGALDLLRPAGYSSIAGSLEAAASDFPDGGHKRIVLLTGSVEDCDEDPCAAATRLIREGIVDRIHVLAVGLETRRRRHLDCIGDYEPYQSEEQIYAALRRIFRELRGNQGTVSVFEPDGGGWVASAALGEELTLAAGKYDLLIRDAEKTHLWRDVRVEGEVEVKSGSKPPRKLR